MAMYILIFEILIVFVAYLCCEKPFHLYGQMLIGVFHLPLYYRNSGHSLQGYILVSECFYWIGFIQNRTILKEGTA